MKGYGDPQWGPGQPIGAPGFPGGYPAPQPGAPPGPPAHYPAPASGYPASGYVASPAAPTMAQSAPSPFAPGYGARSGVEVTMGFFPLAWLLFFCRPVVEINGYPNPLGWGTHFVNLPPGRYVVAIYFPYCFQSRCGLNSCEVILQPGAVRRVNYYMWPLVFIPGSISVS